MLTPDPRPATCRAATSPGEAGLPALIARRGFRFVSGLAAVAIMIALPLAVAGPASADQARHRQLWVLSALDVPAAWRLTQGRGVIVAVIDSGVDPSVSDLRGSVITGPDYSGVRTPPSNPNWGAHGTWMASLIAGHGHGRGARNGILGVAPKAKILSIRVITDVTDPGYHAYRHEPEWRGQGELAKAIRFAVRHGADVISMSLGYGAWSLDVRAALQYALSHRVVVVASSGNAGTTHMVQSHGNAPYSFPADYPGVIGVAAVTQAGQPAYFSSENLSVQVAAPGVNVPAQGRGSKYWIVSGTSPACALTAGVAALIRSKYPKLTAAQVRSAITQSTSNRPRRGYDDQVGFGTVDAAAALRMAGRLAKQVPGGQTLAAKAAASGNFGNGPGGVPAFPVPPRGRQKLLVFLGIGAGGLLLVILALWVLVRGRRKRKAARPAFPAARPVRTGRPGTLVRPGSVGAVGAAGAPGAAAASGTDPDVRYPAQIYPSQPQGHGLPVQGYLGQPGQGFPVPGYLGPPGQAQLGPGQYGHVQPPLGPGPYGPGQPGQPALPGQPTPGYAGHPGQPAPGYAGQPGQPAPGYAGQPGQPAPGYAGQPGFAGQPAQPAAGYGAPGYGGPGYGGPGYGGPGYGVTGYGPQPQPGQHYAGPSFPAAAGPAAASQDFPPPVQTERGSSAPSYSSQSYSGQTFAPQGDQAAGGGHDNAGQADSSESEWIFDDGPAEAAPPATTAPRLPIPPRPLEQRQDLIVQPLPSRPTEGDAADWRSEQGHRTVVPPGRTLLPEPDTGRWLDDPLTSPRYSREAHAGEESWSRGYRSDWLTGREGITRPTSQPARPAPAEPPVEPAQPVTTDQSGTTEQSRTPEQSRTTERPAEPAWQTQAAQPQPPWAFDPSAAPGPTHSPIWRTAEVADRSGVSQPAHHPGEPSAGHPGAPAGSQPASPSADPSVSQPSGQAEPVMRSVWEPLTKHRTSLAQAASDQAVEHPSPIARSGTWASAAWDARLAQQPATIVRTEPGTESPASSAPDAGAAGPSPAALSAAGSTGPSAESSVSHQQPGSVPRQTAPPSAEPLPRRQPQSEAEPLPRRQPMTHIAAPLRRDRQSQPGRQPEAGRQQQADTAEPLPSVWDTWRPAADAKRAAQADGSDPADDNP